MSEIKKSAKNTNKTEATQIRLRQQTIAEANEKVNLNQRKTKCPGALEHYVLQTVKAETPAEGSESEDIDFVLAEEDVTHPSGVITEELDFSGGEDNSTAGAPTQEIIEHICGKCYKTFKSIPRFKNHLDFCRYDSEYHLRKAEMLENLEKIEKDGVAMEKKDMCFCCGESYDTFHLGHITCPDCPKSFKTQASYERHIFVTHSESNIYPCDICNAQMRSAGLLELHHQQHVKIGKPFACKLCGKDFTRAYHLNRHIKYSACAENGNTQLKCKVCSKTFHRLDNLRTHLKTHLGTPAPKKAEYTCSVCKACFYSFSTLNIHMRTHTGERPFDCDLCEKKFPSLVALKKHRRHHTGEKPYSCPKCNQTFAVKEVLNRHLKRHTGERPHTCTECNKSFIQMTQLRVHIKTHLRPFECTLCKDKFKTEKQLDAHTIKVHPSTKGCLSGLEFPLKCEDCNTRFKFPMTLKRHLQSNGHLAKVQKLNKQKNTTCFVCKKNFDTVQNLNFHMLKEHDINTETAVEKSPNATGNGNDVASASNANNISASPAKRLSNSPKVAATKTTPTIIKVEKLVTKVQEIHRPISQYNSADGIVVQEYIVDDLPTTSRGHFVDGNGNSVLNNGTTFTIIPLEDESKCRTETSDSKMAMKVETSPNKSQSPIKAEAKKSLAESLAAAIADGEEMEDDILEMSKALTKEDEELQSNVTKLLDMLVDKATLLQFGWPDAPVEDVLCRVIENCGHDFSKNDEYLDYDYMTRMREYVKLLFTVVIQNESIKELLNNYTIDEVIAYVLDNGEDDDMDDSS